MDDAVSTASSQTADARSCPRVSVLLPVYNSEEFLDRCLESILAQTYGVFEVVAIDDGSTDSSWEILGRHALRDSRLRPFRQENAGVSAARNAAMDRAAGEILVFVDADDELRQDALEKIVSAFDGNEVETVVFGARCVPQEDASERIMRLLSPRDAVYGAFDSALLFSENAQPYVFRTSIKADLTRREGVRFVEGLRLAEDVAFQFAVYSLSKGVALISDKLYVYRMNKASATHVFDEGRRLADKLDNHLAAIREILRVWAEHDMLDACPAETVQWALDLTLFDISRLSSKEMDECFFKLDAMLSDAFGQDYVSLPERSAVRSMAQRLHSCGASALLLGSSGKIRLARFFAATRGIKECLQRLAR